MAAPTFTTDRAGKTLTITADLSTDAEGAWALWADPRVLEGWWGPPEHPCQVTHFDLQPGGSVTYAMTGPDGTIYPGWWQILAVEQPVAMTIRDGFGSSPDEASLEMPVSTSTVTFREIPTGIRMTITSSYESLEAFDHALSLGMEEGFMAALGQIAFLQRS
jgi:uncharacterized protein YndB with AHSA1/START domain